MKRILLAILFVLLSATVAVADCTTHTYYINGRLVICTTCCTGTFCNTTCT